MRRLLFSLVACLPLVAAGTAVAATDATAGPDQLADAGSADAPASSGSILSPQWHVEGEQSWQLMARSSGIQAASKNWHSLGFSGLGFAAHADGGLAYTLNPSWAAHADVSQQSWFGVSTMNACLSANAALREDSCRGFFATPQLIGSRVGATFKSGDYSVDMDLSKTRSAAQSSLLPRVVPNAPMTTAVNGLPFYSLQDSTSLQARGRMALGDNGGIDVGASVGRIRLLPGNMLGIDTLGQRSLSLGMNSGSVSGRIVGRMIEPESGVAASALGSDHRWTSVDLGVTWRLPWQGALSFGAQNVWSSGHAPKPKDGPEPDQSRIPYVQYHQDF